MSRGVLIHACNNEKIDYTLIALCNALAIKTHLHVPVCLVTTDGALNWLRQNHGVLVARAFDHIIRRDAGRVSNRRFNDTATRHMLPWYNQTRPDSYALSPFDETLLIDADYLILDDTLSKVWGSVHDVMINRDIIPLNHGPVPSRERWLEDTGIQLCWATCVYFRKSLLAETLFDLVQHVKDKYSYYAMIYGFPVQLYRNDYAFSIAVHMLSGFTHCDDIATLPSPFLFTSFDCDELIEVPSKDDLTFLLNDRCETWRFTVTRTKGISVHVMNKFAIVRQAEKLLALYGTA
jgi:hypothetical protein